jgi:hypothetical protein
VHRRVRRKTWQSGMGAEASSRAGEPATGMDAPSPTGRGRRAHLVGTVALLGAFAALGGCKDDPFGTPPGVDAEAVVLAGEGIEGVVGETTGEVVVQLRDRTGEALAGVSVRFEAAPGAGSTSPSVVETDGEGIARTEWKLGPLAGEQRLEVRLASGGASLGILRAEARPGPAFELSVLPEEVTLRAGVPFALSTVVRDAYGNPIAGVPTEWISEDRGIAAVSPEGRVTGLAVGTTGIQAVLHDDAATTHPEIYEALMEGPSAHHRPGHAGGRSQVDVTDGDGEAYVTAVSGDGQVGMVGERLAEPLGVQVVDANGVPLRQVAVEWEVEAGGGSVSRSVTHTDGQGRASVEWTLGPTAGSQRVRARVGSLGSVRFTATALDGTEGGSGDDDDGSGGDDGGSDDGSDDDDAIGSPGQVTDLRVHETGETSATLRFTQVDDGSGAAANYQVRFALHPMGWGWGGASQVTEGTCAGEITGTQPGATLTCSVEGLQPGTRYDFQLISYRGLIADGSRVYGDLSNIATGTTDHADSDDGDSGGGSSTLSYTNEPSGNSLIAWSPMSEMFTWGPSELASGYGSWWQWREGDPDTTLRTDGGAPGGPYVNRTRYREGLEPGRAPVNWGAWEPGSTQSGDEYRTIYFSQTIRLVDTGTGDWESQGVGTKLGFFGVGRCSGSNAELYLLMQGGTRSDFTIRMMQQGPVSRGMRQNVHESPVFAVGQWHHMEIEMVLNDIGRSNGVIRWWVDGRLVMEYRDVVYRTSDDPCGFLAWKWNPTWGGTGGSARSRDDFIDISDVRISGRPL